MSAGKIRTYTMCALIAGLVMTYQACSQAVEYRGPASAKPQGLQNGGTTTDNPKPTVDVSIAPHSVAIIQEAQICVDDVRFRKVSSDGTDVSATPFIRHFRRSTTDDALARAAKTVAAHLQGRDIMIVREGTYIDAFHIPRGNFNVVELILGDDCNSERSLSLKINDALMTSRESVTMRFDGDGAEAGTANIQLNMQAILEALAKAKSNGEFKKILESAHGTFQ